MALGLLRTIITLSLHSCLHRASLSWLWPYRLLQRSANRTHRSRTEDELLTTGKMTHIDCAEQSAIRNEWQTSYPSTSTGAVQKPTKCLLLAVARSSGYR